MTAPPTSRLRKALLLAAGLCAWAALAAGGLVMATAAAAQPVQAVPPSSRLANPARIERQAADFVQSYGAFTSGASASSRRTGRWARGLCVAFDGLAPAQETAVSARIEEVAKTVGVGVRPADCEPANLEIAVTANPQGLLNRLVEEDSQLLGDRTSDSRTARIVTLPIQAWYWTNGAALADRATSAPTRLFTNVLVIVDLRRPEIKTKTLGLLADYLAMLALSQPRDLGQCNVLPSITDLFAACPGRPGPAGLTPADAAYLSALYAGDAEPDIVERMANILAGGKEDARLSFRRKP